MKYVAALLAVFVTLPIWLYLLYQILVRVDASELMWFLYWIYVPFQFLVLMIAKVYEVTEK